MSALRYKPTPTGCRADIGHYVITVDAYGDTAPFWWWSVCLRHPSQVGMNRLTGGREEATEETAIAAAEAALVDIVDAYRPLMVTA